jgi:hypothetical protein
VQRVIKQVRIALPALLYFAEEVEVCQQEAIERLGESAVGLIAWAWQHRKILGEQPQQLLAVLDPAWQTPASRLLEAWNQTVRASSVAATPHFSAYRLRERGKSYWTSSPGRVSLVTLSRSSEPCLISEL